LLLPRTRARLALTRGTFMFSRMVMAALLLTSPAWAQDQVAQPATATAPVYTRETPIEVLAADPAAAAVVNKDLPGLLTDSDYPFFKAMSLHAVQQASGGDLSATDVDKTVADLQALPPH
jgi:hypothetical protein